MKRKLLVFALIAAWIGGASCADDEPACLWDDPNCDPPQPSCVSGQCGARALSDNPYCGADCQRLEQLSQGCLGSHTEQDCVACGVTYVRVGGNDESIPFYDAQGDMVAISIVGEGEGSCADAWFGIDLSECVPTGDVRRVPCDSPGP